MCFHSHSSSSWDWEAAWCGWLIEAQSSSLPSPLCHQQQPHIRRQRMQLWRAEHRAAGQAPWEEGHGQVGNSHSRVPGSTMTASSSIILNCIILRPHPLTLLQFCNNDLWHKYDLVSLLVEVIHHRLPRFLKKWTASFTCLVTTIVAEKTSKEPMNVLINIHSSSWVTLFEGENKQRWRGILLFLLVSEKKAFCLSQD